MRTVLWVYPSLRLSDTAQSHTDDPCSRLPPCVRAHNLLKSDRHGGLVYTDSIIARLFDSVLFLLPHCFIRLNS